MNDDLRNLHEMLMAQHESLYAMLDTAPDAETMEAILTEMRELRHRIDLVQGLLFRETTLALQASLEKVRDADRELTKALKAADTAASVVTGIGKFLTMVDKAIDLAKKLAPMAVGL